MHQRSLSLSQRAPALTPCVAGGQRPSEKASAALSAPSEKASAAEGGAVEETRLGEIESILAAMQLELQREKQARAAAEQELKQLAESNGTAAHCHQNDKIGT